MPFPIPLTILVSGLRRPHRTSVVPVPVVNVGVVRVRMHDVLVPMGMGMRLPNRILWTVRVLVVLVVHVQMGMSDRLVDVRVLVALREVQP